MAPRNIVTQLFGGDIHIAWDSPDTSRLDGEIQGYKVIYHPVTLDQGMTTLKFRCKMDVRLQVAVIIR